METFVELWWAGMLLLAFIGFGGMIGLMFYSAYKLFHED